ncbi:MAG TPA: small basic family protein [Armatimonadota bacterium]|jgi:small basic protein
MIWLPVLAFAIGFGAVYLRQFTVPAELASYLSLAAVAGVDTILGGIRSGFEGKFENDIFVSGFVVNTLMAAALAYFGDQIGVQDLYLAAVVALGGRIFLNLSLIRRYWLAKARTARLSNPEA